MRDADVHGPSSNFLLQPSSPKLSNFLPSTSHSSPAITRAQLFQQHARPLAACYFFFFFFV
jgi:hypothetical protein